MNHPTPEAWMAYLYDDFAEMPGAARAETEAHLAACPVCRREVDQWRATLNLLNTDEVAPMSTSRPATVLVPFPSPAEVAEPARKRGLSARPSLWPWALAAGVLVAAAFLAGRSLGPNPERLQREIGKVREQMTGEILTELRAAQRSDLAEISAATVTASVASQREWATGLIDGFVAGRIADRNDFLATLDRVDRRHADEMAQLREGFQLLAEKTGGAFQQTESQLKALASSLPASNSPGSPDSH